MRGDGPRGSETPRIGTEPLRPLTPRTSLGFECAEFVEQVLDIRLMPWQRWWLLHALELDETGGFRFRMVLTLVGRQSGKTTLLKCVALWLMYTGRVRLILGAAQTLDIARESWQGVVELAQGDAGMRAEVDQVRRANGEQEIRLVNGARYKIAAANRSAGRGLSVDLLILDELREHRDFLAWAALSKTTQARPNGLIIAISNAGDDYSAVLNQLRENALAGTERTLGLFEWSAPDGCDLDDHDAWAQGSPGLGYTISTDAIRSSLATDPPAVFRTEVLCQRVESMDTPITPQAWEACADMGGSLVSSLPKVHFCLDVAPDGEHATLAAAGIGDDGRVRVGVVHAWSSLALLRAELPVLLRDHKPKTLGWFPNGPAASMLADLQQVRGVKRVDLKAGDVPGVCQGFAEQVHARAVLHGGDPLLTAHVLGSRRLPVGDGWRFQRRGGNADAAYAAAGAVHLARTQVVRAPKVVVARTA